MLVTGTSGFAIQLTDILHQAGIEESLYYFNDVDDKLPERFLNKYPILRTLEQVKEYFDTAGRKYALGLGNPANRKIVADKMNALGGELTTVISPHAILGDCSIGRGANVLSKVVVESTAGIGEASLLNIGVTVTHGCSIGAYCEFGPGAIICGDCEIGDYVFIGAGAVILPKMRIGHHSVIAAGSVVTRNVPDNAVVRGVPAK